MAKKYKRNSMLLAGRFPTDIAKKVKASAKLMKTSVSQLIVTGTLAEIERRDQASQTGEN